MTLSGSPNSAKRRVSALLRTETIASVEKGTEHFRIHGLEFAYLLLPEREFSEQDLELACACRGDTEAIEIVHKVERVRSIFERGHEVHQYDLLLSPLDGVHRGDGDSIDVGVPQRLADLVYAVFIHRNDAHVSRLHVGCANEENGERRDRANAARIA